MLKKFLVICLLAIALSLGYSYPSLADAVNSGAEVFSANCAGCHPKGGNIIRRGKTLKAKALSKNKLDSVAGIIALVSNGKGNMPAYSDRLSKEEIDTVSHYVLEQAAVNWHS